MVHLQRVEFRLQFELSFPGIFLISLGRPYLCESFISLDVELRDDGLSLINALLQSAPFKRQQTRTKLICVFFHFGVALCLVGLVLELTHSGFHLGAHVIKPFHILLSPVQLEKCLMTLLSESGNTGGFFYKGTELLGFAFHNPADHPLLDN